MTPNIFVPSTLRVGGVFFCQNSGGSTTSQRVAGEGTLGAARPPFHPMRTSRIVGQLSCKRRTSTTSRKMETTLWITIMTVFHTTMRIFADGEQFLRIS